MNLIRHTVAATLIGMTALSMAPFANAESTLYATPPPDDAAFVRWLDASASYEAFGYKFANVERPTDFRFFPASGAEGATPGGYYSRVTAADGTIMLVEEPGRSDPTKVHIVLVNATNGPARLVVADQDAVVIDATELNAAGIRGVNPVTAALAVQSADGAVEYGRVEVTLRRGQDITIVARDGGVELIEDRFGVGPETR
jgi:hypothetical protein